MRTLFVRIFLWFWLAIAVVVVLLVLSSPFFTRSRPGLARWQRVTEEQVSTWARDAATLLERGGPGALRQPGWRRRHGGQRVVVLDSNLRELSGQQPPAEVLAVARHAAESGSLVTERTGSLYASATAVTAPDGSRYTVVAVQRRPPVATDLLEPRWLLPRLLLLIVVAGGLCFWLARHLTGPLASLRKAVRLLAAGDLSVRVEAPVSRRQDEMGELARDVNSMAGRLGSLLEAQQRLLRDVSHELRSPLARLGVALELARGPSSPETARALDRIGEESERLNLMIERVLTVARLEAGADTAERRVVDLAVLAGRVVADASFEAQHRPCTARLQAAGACLVMGAAEPLHSAIENVVRNAVRYTSEGSEVVVAVERMTGEDGAEAVVTVRDHGPGVPESELANLFQPFYRLAAARERGSGGSGLGLAITSSVLRHHGGTATARNASDGGLLVELRLPAH